jgi:hypothetical protein
MIFIFQPDPQSPEKISSLEISATLYNRDQGAKAKSCSTKELCRDKPEGNEDRYAGEEDQGHPDTGFTVDLGNKIGSGDIDGDSSRERQTGTDPTRNEVD